MKVKLDSGAKCPTRAHATDAGLDLYSMEDQIIGAKESAVFDTGVHIALDITGEGVIDVGYTGSIKVKLYNNSGFDYKIKAGDKISQLVIPPIFTPPLEVADELDDSERGVNGFGSSGR